MTGHARQHIATVIGANLAAAREAAELTQRALAVELGISERMISRWETGKHRPSALYEQALADRFFDGEVSAMYREPLEAAA